MKPATDRWYMGKKKQYAASCPWIAAQAVASQGGCVDGRSWWCVMVQGLARKGVASRLGQPLPNTVAAKAWHLACDVQQARTKTRPFLVYSA